MIKPEIFSFVTKESIELNMSLYRANNNKRNITIIYFHGGGLLYGVRDDLPELYVNKFLSAGFDLLALDYPLAPESKLDLIIDSSLQALNFYLENYNNVLGLEDNKYLLFGRSAGAYLCLNLCNLIVENNSSLPLGIISLYGYARLDEVEFITPSKHYNKLAKVPDEGIEKIISSMPITYGPMSERFSLYIKARQEASWVKYLCDNDDLQKYSLSEESLRKFPPTFLAAATLDPDVPYRASKNLSKIIPNSVLITVYKDEHDFDRDLSDNTGICTYDKIISWIDGLCFN